MTRSRFVVLASALAAALLCNYWVLEGLLADRTDFDASWISDLSTRSEGSGPTFVALGVASGLAVCAYALVLLAGPLGERRPAARDGPWARGGPWVRRGLWALLAAGALTVLASAAPLSCAEGLEASCELREDGLDLVHALATAGEIIATALAFALLGLGLRLHHAQRGCPLSAIGGRRTTTTRESGQRTTTAREGGRRTTTTREGGQRTTTTGEGGRRTTTLGEVGALTLVVGAVWVGLTIVTGVSYVSDGVDAVKGALQRSNQLIFGGWLLALAWATLRDAGGDVGGGGTQGGGGGGVGGGGE